MSRVGNCYDNGSMESVFGHIKREMFERCKYVSLGSLAENILAFVDYYNTTRTQLGLDGLSPVAFRIRYEAQQEATTNNLIDVVNVATEKSNDA